VKNTYTMAEVVGQMHLLREPLPARVHPTPPPNLPHLPGKSRLDEIRERGFVRVGYFTDRLPYAFENARGELVGFDIEMAHDLARTLGVTLEFVAADRERLEAEVKAGICDIVMSGLALTPERAARLGLSASYRDETLAFVVESYRRKLFQSRAAIQAQAGLRIGILREPYFLAQLHAALPGAEAVELSSPREFFEGTGAGVDAFLYTAEAGSAWTLLYPKFAVVVPQPGLLSIPLAYALPRGEPDWLDFVNAWIELKRKDGTLARLYEYWIQGRGAVPKQPRWSVLRNVLGWVE
jgi:ABC-type amino acid transport substrate-binding protein